MPFGYTGKMLHVDLSHGALTIEAPPGLFYRKYMGGSAFGLYYVLREMPAGVEPLSPENVLTLMLSVTTGAPISGQSRLMVNAKSPVSHGIGDAQSGGFFPRLPKKFFKALKGTGPTSGVAIDPDEFEAALNLTYQLNGWTADGVPTPAKLADLGISWLADEIYPVA